mmetsp:Transcript_1836/g.3037  ORF Transcript_1836/g.3037 Transcript_1836/m.3037 type:complete len:242 (+) Transcript_1836:49-774(+)|eukprot:CAMPEP_0168590310 /NCGR_PEP_ID=MMETSP0420-20121227/6497_1 /TAXON_ID=498008 /ORGANISM="Pessonella sp." /LENGTH=241 /DNA_ID=CAMNT_0008625955 /DNA_START=50 /DNA_END=775 /DNA_ORIENTATION=-
MSSMTDRIGKLPTGGQTLATLGDDNDDEPSSDEADFKRQMAAWAGDARLFKNFPVGIARANHMVADVEELKLFYQRLMRFLVSVPFNEDVHYIISCDKTLIAQHDEFCKQYELEPSTSPLHFKKCLNNLMKLCIVHTSLTLDLDIQVFNRYLDHVNSLFSVAKLLWCSSSGMSNNYRHGESHQRMEWKFDEDHNFAIALFISGECVHHMESKFDPFALLKKLADHRSNKARLVTVTKTEGT